MAGELAARGRTALVFRGSDGLDELTTTGSSQIWKVANGEVFQMEFDPATIGIARSRVEDLLGGDARENAELALQVLSGDDSGRLGAISDIVALNAAAGISAYELAKGLIAPNFELHQTFEANFEKARNALATGIALSKFEEWSAATQCVAG